MITMASRAAGVLCISMLGCSGARAGGSPALPDAGAPAADGATSRHDAAPRDEGDASDPCVGVSCVAPSHGTSACRAGSCVTSCDSGYSALDGECVSGTVCSGRRCLDGQSCGESGCELPCDDPAALHVPGDYATLGAALDALWAAEAGGTVCLAPGDYGDQSIYARRLVTVVGGGPEQLRFGTIDVGGPVAVRGFSAARIGARGFEGASAQFTACRVTEEVRADVSTSIGAGWIDLAFAGCEIGGPGSGGVRVTVPPFAHAGAFLTLESCWIHDSMEAGVRAGSSEGEPMTVTIRNCTLTGNASGIEISGRTTAATVVNDVIVGSGVAIELTETVPVTYSHIALWNNTTRYAGIAGPPPGLVTDDPRLDASSPPAPMPGSALLGAADPSTATSADFYGVSRAGRADIGAVQGP